MLFADANTALLAASVIVPGDDPLTQPLRLEIYHDEGALGVDGTPGLANGFVDPDDPLVARSMPAAGRETASMAPAKTGPYIVRVRNTGANPIRYEIMFVTSQK